MASNLMESNRYTGRYWECPMCAKKFYPPRAGEVRQPVSLRGTCSHDMCMRCVVEWACPVQLNEAIDTGKPVTVQCPIVFGEEGDRCEGTFLIDGQQWGVRGGNVYHHIIEWYDNEGCKCKKEGESGK